MIAGQSVLRVAVMMATATAAAASTNDSYTSRDAADWYDTGQFLAGRTAATHYGMCPSLPEMSNAQLHYTEGVSAFNSRYLEGTVATYVCDDNYRMSFDLTGGRVAGAGLHDHVQHACVPEFIVPVSSRKTNATFVCSKTNLHLIGQWIPMRTATVPAMPVVRIPVRKSPWQSPIEWRPTKVTYLTDSKPYPTSVIYNTWSLRNPDVNGGAGGDPTWWARLGRTDHDRFLLLLIGVTLLVMFSFVLRGIVRTFCDMGWAPPTSAAAAAATYRHPQQTERRSRHAVTVATIQSLARELAAQQQLQQQQQHQRHSDEGRPVTSVTQVEFEYDDDLEDESGRRLPTGFSVILLPIPKESPDTSLPSYEEATGLPSYDDIRIAEPPYGSHHTSSSSTSTTVKMTSPTGDARA